jgi:hypothetical protein
VSANAAFIDSPDKSSSETKQAERMRRNSDKCWKRTFSIANVSASLLPVSALARPPCRNPAAMPVADEYQPMTRATPGDHDSQQIVIFAKDRHCQTLPIPA